MIGQEEIIVWQERRKVSPWTPGKWESKTDWMRSKNKPSEDKNTKSAGNEGSVDQHFATNEAGVWYEMLIQMLLTWNHIKCWSCCLVEYECISVWLHIDEVRGNFRWCSSSKSSLAQRLNHPLPNCQLPTSNGWTLPLHRPSVFCSHTAGWRRFYKVTLDSRWSGWIITNGCAEYSLLMFRIFLSEQSTYYSRSIVN